MKAEIIGTHAHLNDTKEGRAAAMEYVEAIQRGSSEEDAARIATAVLVMAGHVIPSPAAFQLTT